MAVIGQRQRERHEGDDHQPEDPKIEISYGLVAQEYSLNPLWVAYGGFVKLIRDLCKAHSWRDRRDLLIKPPGWTPAPTSALGNP